VSPYLSASELAVILPQGASIGASTSPLTLGEVGTINAQVAAEVDGYLAAAGMIVPISTTATSAYAQVQRIVMQGAAAQVLDILFPNLGGGDTTLASDYRNAYEKALKMIADKKLALPGASQDTSEAGRSLPRSFQTTNPGADAALTAASPLISINWAP
jgi:hypothetical protein